jgi:formylglycine-generating enzyme required for sulfatase activity
MKDLNGFCGRAALFFALLFFSIAGAGGALQPPSEFTLGVSGTDITVRFGTVVGQTYSVEKSTSLAQGSWTVILGNATGTGAVQTTTDAGSLPKCFYRIRYGATSTPTPDLTGFALIPAGSFQMGDSMGDVYSGIGLPVHAVDVSAFYMEKNLVTKAQWDEVYAWAAINGYTFDSNLNGEGPHGQGKAPDHPVQTVDWMDCVKWCNARSEKEGLVPCYTVGGTTYKSGSSDGVACNLSASGYRLPTEAEWEKAARGGLIGKRFPWGDTISQSQANYPGNTFAYSLYDLGPNGPNPTYATGSAPYTSPVGSFAANGYGLYDMAGNVFEWCWDWYGEYGSGAVSDPTGPDSGASRIYRGGSWYWDAFGCRAAFRYGESQVVSADNLGFRCAIRSSVP